MNIKLTTFNTQEIHETRSIDAKKRRKLWELVETANKYATAFTAAVAETNFAYHVPTNRTSSKELMIIYSILAAAEAPFKFSS